MADYQPLISRAVAGLDKNTGENRRALYERARKALVDQLRGVDPPLSETDITRERLALEEAIRRVETEAVRQSRPAPPPVRARPAPPAPPAAPPQPSAPPPAAPEQPPANGETEASGGGRRRFEHRWIEKKPPPAPPTPPAEREGAPGFKDVVADADGLGGAVARTARSARETYSAMPPPSDSEPVEPRTEEPEPARELPRPAEPPARPPAPERAAVSPAGAGAAEPPESESLEPPVMEGERYAEPPPQGGRVSPLARRTIGRIVKLAAAVLVLALVAGGIYWQRAPLTAMVNTLVAMVHPTPQPVQRETAQPSTKIPDRITQQPGPAPQQQQEAPVAQRVVLYEEDPGDPAGKRFVGTVLWRTETFSPGPGQPPDRGVRADINIPDRNMQVTWSLRRNTDKDLPASHTISIQFVLPPDFPHGEISEIRGVLMKQSEQTRGTSLAGLAVKVTKDFFLIGLTANEQDVARNIDLLKNRTWFDVALVYKDGRRAILAVEKGNPGDRAFQDAFSAWGQ